MDDIEKLLELPELMHTAKSLVDYYERSGNPKYLKSSMGLIKGMKQDFEAAREALNSQYGFNADSESLGAIPVNYSVDLENIDSDSDPASQIMAVNELYSEFRETEEYVVSVIDKTDVPDHLDAFPEDR